MPLAGSDVNFRRGPFGRGTVRSQQSREFLRIRHGGGDLCKFVRAVLEFPQNTAALQSIDPSITRHPSKHRVVIGRQRHLYRPGPGCPRPTRRRPTAPKRGARNENTTVSNKVPAAGFHSFKNTRVIATHCRAWNERSLESNVGAWRAVFPWFC